MNFTPSEHRLAPLTADDTVVAVRVGRSKGNAVDDFPAKGRGTVRLLKVAEPFKQHVDTAITMLAYLHQEIDFGFDGEFILVEAGKVPNRESLKVAAAHALYREKILKDSAPLRLSIYEKLLRR